jgi:type VI secretion system protein ImpC
MLGRLKPEIEVPAADGTSLCISFSSLEDFHPDSLFVRVPSFGKMRETREALRNPATASEAVARFASPAHSAVPTQTESTEETLERLLGRASAKATARPATTSGTVEALLKQIVAPHVVASPDPNTATVTAAADSAISAEMRMLLHHPIFQELEAAWRSLDFLVRNLETDETLQVFVLDVSRAEVAADLGNVDDLARSGLFKNIVEETVQSPGAVPWTVVVGNYTFGKSAEDADLLARLAKISAAGGAPLLAGGAGEFVQAALSGEEPAGEAWRAMRERSDATSIGLAAPRFLLRLPYGRETDRTTSFDFEEIPGEPLSSAYLWGNSAFVCTCLLGQSFRENGWEMSPGDSSELSGLPVHTFRADGETKMAPCAEQWLTDKHAENLLEFGIIPVVSIRGRDAVRVLRFQSIAKPSRALAGSWNG